MVKLHNLNSRLNILFTHSIMYLLLDESTNRLEQDSLSAADQVYAKHSGLLKKGFALAPFLNIQQVMDGVLPLRLVKLL